MLKGAANVFGKHRILFLSIKDRPLMTKGLYLVSLFLSLFHEVYDKSFRDYSLIVRFVFS